MSSRALGLVREAVNNAGMEISHVYEDLIFLQHVSFILQFGEEDNDVYIHVNKEASLQDLEWPISLLSSKGKQSGITFHKGKRYKLIETGEETIQLEFIATKSTNVPKKNN